MISVANKEAISNAVVEAVAAEMGARPTDLPERLYDVIAADSLDALFVGRGGAGTVTFTFCGYTVTATADGEVIVD